MAAGDNRGHGGNNGYDDQFDAYYSWDSNVPNHKNLQVGDPIALWDKERLLGISVIEAIETSPGFKELSRCPHCRATRISERKLASPRFRCMQCRSEFEFAVKEIVPVEVYQARYDAAWTSLDGVLNEQEVRSLAVNPKEFNAMRPIHWDALEQALLEKNAERALGRIAARADLNTTATSLQYVPAHGFNDSFVRVRRGQRQFRQHILTLQGSVCAFTGGAPERVLDAGHLYSYAELGTHFKHGGLMLRKDIHRLFDDGLLAVDPRRLTIDVAPTLEKYEQYAVLHDRRLHVGLRDEQVLWLDKHWTEHRAVA
ncbi:HNH endonuclease signature motif containing protein [Phycicoccus sp. DTK01]|uniref:HNH endonuclease signature motif containing protein n=1 Tax=Phycicoccus sp. DTK01 TaxID=2785745 RepID=UPI001A8CD527|nr:HNH endonuclease signature motif containing protein [Phycicoccus sp. DTK01]GIL37700.1 hypothetical protein PDTK01_37750 [Phycicoccus sp. DTK01]